MFRLKFAPKQLGKFLKNTIYRYRTLLIEQVGQVIKFESRLQNTRNHQKRFQRKVVGPTSDLLLRTRERVSCWQRLGRSH